MIDILKKLIDFIRQLLGKESPIKPEPVPVPPKPTPPSPPPPKPVGNKLMWRNGGLWVGDKPYWLCGVGDPENFLWRKDQAKMIQKLRQYNIRGMVAYLVQTHGGDAAHENATDWNPFINHNPQKGLNHSVLNKFNQWFMRLDEAGCCVVLNLYDDEAMPFTKDKNLLPPKEIEYIKGIVQRFKHLTHLIWMVAEEYQEIMTHNKVHRIAKLIRSIDPIHPIGVHQIHSDSFNFKSNPFLNLFFMQLNNADKHELKKVMSNAVKEARGRYGVVLFENTEPGLDIYGTGKIARDKDRVCAEAGAYVMRYERGQWKFPDSDLLDMKRLAMEMEARQRR